MATRSRNDRNDAQNYNREAGYEHRFGSAGMKGSHRYAAFEPETYGSRGRNTDEFGNPRHPAHGDYSTFEGTTNRPYYGGEEGSFPYGGPSYSDERRPSYNADERARYPRGEHTGKGPKGYRRSDERIREEVSEMLTDHGEIDASEIIVDVREGVVALSGTVESRRIKRLVEDWVERINGVMDVQNNLQIMGHGIRGEAATDFSRSAREDQSEAPQTQGSHTSARSVNKDRNSRSTKSKTSTSRQFSQ